MGGPLGAGSLLKRSSRPRGGCIGSRSLPCEGRDSTAKRAANVQTAQRAWGGRGPGNKPSVGRVCGQGVNTVCSHQSQPAPQGERSPPSQPTWHPSCPVQESHPASRILHPASCIPSHAPLTLLPPHSPPASPSPSPVCPSSGRDP